jgi:hypothetical protein
VPVDPAQLVTRYERLWSRAQTYRAHCQELADYVMPGRNPIIRTGVEGEKRTQRVYDSTAIEARKLLSASMQGALTNHALRWFSLKTRNQANNDTWEVQAWLEDAEERMSLALRQSNFYEESFLCYDDLATFATAALYCEENEKPPTGAPFGGLLFRALPIQEYVIEEAHDGLVDTVLRSFELSARAAIQRFGRDTVSEQIRGAMDSGRGDDRFRILHGVYPRADAERTRYGSRGLPVVSCYVEHGTRTLLRESGFHEFPYAVPRWSKLSGEVYGTDSPAMIALPDIKTLNQADMLTLQSGELAIRPPYVQMEDGIVGDIDLRPNGQTVLTRPDALRPLETGGKFDVGQLLMEQRRQRIQRIFFWEQLQLVEGRTMTATEVERRWEIMRRILGPTLGRFEYEFLNRVIERVFALMFRAGALLPPPEAVLGDDLDIEYEGPLARSQKSQRVGGWEATLGHLHALQAVSPEAVVTALDNYDLDDALRDQATIVGLPPSYLRSREEVAQVRAQRQQMQQQALQMQQMGQMAEAAGKAAPMLTAVDQAAQTGRQLPAPQAA